MSRCSGGHCVELTIALNHEGLDDVMSDHFEVRMSVPMANGCFGSGEEIVQDSDFMPEEHEPVD